MKTKRSKKRTEDSTLLNRVQRLEKIAWASLTLAAAVWKAFTKLEQLSWIEERIRTLAYLESMPPKSSL